MRNVWFRPVSGLRLTRRHFVLRVCKEIIGAFLRIMINNIFTGSLDQFETTKEEQVVEYFISQDLSTISHCWSTALGFAGVYGSLQQRLLRPQGTNSTHTSTLNEKARKQYSTWRIWPAPSTRQTLLITSNDQTSSVREARKNLHNPRRGTGNLGGDQDTNSDPPLVGKIIKIRYPCS